MVSPVKLSHYVLQTNRIAEMRDWYLAVLGGEVVHQDDKLCFLAYDDEHHRIAFVAFGPFEARREHEVGLHHVAFTFASLGELLGTYERLKKQGVVPHWCINHGPTTSLYYHDPDGNGLEIQVDNFPDVADCKAFMRSRAFAENPLGVEFDPDEMLKRLRAGVPEKAFLERANLERVMA
ncbi:MAG TPA: VOC family protein [Stellaceae bacterium]|nr:VOC family protein [Stellaceae bacterium]